MDNREIIALLERYTEGLCSPEERALIETWYINRKDLPVNETIEGLAKDLNDIQYQLEQHTKSRTIRLWPRIAVAASIVIAISTGIYFYNSLNHPGENELTKSVSAQDFAPGSNKAMLLLSNGKTIQLSGAKTGVVIGASMLSYNDGTAIASETATELTATTPRGGTYQFTLSDGTRVWLNSASSLKSLSTFTHSKTREVELVGEAYFDVAHDAAKPFRVRSKGQVIEVLGTKFNINAYADEPATRTTLLEGAVTVSTSGLAAKKTEVRLKPGQQTTLQNDRLTGSDADMEEAFAWKNGYFVLNNESLESIMRKLSRWYDIEVVYKGNIPKRQFGGEISRNTNLLEVLEVLELSKVHFTIEGKKIIVTP